MAVNRTKVLVVDDEVEVTYALQAYFQKKGYEMLTAFDGAEAMAHLESKIIDLVLLDLKMPGINGVGVLQYIRTQKPQTRVIVITAFDDEYRGLVEQIGIHGFLNKPFGVEALTKIIERVLQAPVESTVSMQNHPPVDPVHKVATATPKAKLLFIEPSEFLFNIKKVFFESPERAQGEYRVEVAYSMIEALEKLHAFKPDIVLADLVAAGSLGDLVTQILRSDDRPKEVIIHGSGTVSHRQQEKVDALTNKGVHLVLNETFTQAGLKRLNEMIRDVTLQHGLTV